MPRAKSYNEEGKKIEGFQLRINEALGHKECPYAHRWVLNTPWFSIRLHKFHRSDDHRYYHDHAWDFLTFILKGTYNDISPSSDANFQIVKERKTFNLYFVKAEHKHYVEVEKECWTLLLCTNKKRNWGFWVNGKFKRPQKYFYKFGHPPCD